MTVTEPALQRLMGFSGVTGTVRITKFLSDLPVNAMVKMHSFNGAKLYIELC
jgi:hypothetical protein